jgi:hypothetical protein
VHLLVLAGVFLVLGRLALSSRSAPA